MYTIIITFLLPVLLWIKLNKLLKKVLERNLYYFSFRRIQKNPQVFEALLKQQEIAPEGWEELGIEIGNPKAKNVFITVCNPYCVPCASAHTILEEIIAKNDNFRLKIIFNCLDEKSSKVAKHFIELSQNNNAILKQTLDDWYTNSLKRSNINITNFNKDFFSKNIDDHMNQMNIWCKKAVITFTPTIYLNGHKLPDNYMIKDLLDIAKSS